MRTPTASATCSGCGPGPWSRSPARSCTTRGSRSATPPWRCSATSCAPPVDVQARLRDAERHVAGGTERERSHVHAVVDPRPRRLPAADRAPARVPPRRPAALDGRAHDRVRRRHRGARGGVGDRRARDPGVRRRLVVHRPARVRPAGAAPLRRGDGAVLPLAGRGAARRPLRARPGARPLRDRRPRGRPGLDGRLGDRRRRVDREPEPLLLARRPARAVPGRPGRRPEAVRRAAAAGARARLPGARGQRLAAVPVGDHARAPRRCRASRTSPP